MKKSAYALAAVFLALFVGCDLMTGPESGQSFNQEGRAAVSLAITGTGSRTVLPAVPEKAEDVSAWRLRGTRMSGRDILSQHTTGLFSDPAGQTLYLEAGTWDFTLEGYQDGSGETPILRGTILNREITLEGQNTLEFTVGPVSEEGTTGTVRIIIDLPEGHGINLVEVFKDGAKLELDPPLVPKNNSIVLEQLGHAAGDYYYSFRLYKTDPNAPPVLYGVVSELISVWMNLTSEKTYTLEQDDLNLSYVITYEMDGGSFTNDQDSYYSYRYTDADFTLPEPDWSGHKFEGWYDSEADGDPVTQIDQGSTGDKTFWATWSELSSSEAEITAFAIDRQIGESVIDAEKKTVTVTVPSGTDLKNLTPKTFTISEKADVSPKSNVAQDFSGGPVKYTVTAEDGTEAEWFVTVQAGLASVQAITNYLNAATESPVPLPVKINLADGTNGWTALLSAIDSVGKTVDLDLSACTMNGEVFNPGTSITGISKIVSLVLPDAAKSVTRYSALPFKNYTALKSVTSSNVETIGTYAFEGCTNLETVEFSGAITIQANAFEGCTKLTTVILPSAETIGNEAFWALTALKTVSLPKATTIGNQVFYDTGTGDLTITLGSTAPLLGTRMFQNAGAKPVTVNVPVDVSASYNDAWITKLKNGNNNLLVNIETYTP